MFAISPNPETHVAWEELSSADLSRVANQLRPLAGENRPDQVKLSPNPPWAQQRLSLQGWILALRAVSCTGTRTRGAQFLRRVVLLPTHGSALVLGASCVDRGLSFGSQRSTKAASSCH